MTDNREQRALSRERIGWVAYDWANSAFVLCVITVLGSAYFVALFEGAAERAGGARLGSALALPLGGTMVTAEAAWSFIVAGAALFVAVTSPLLGAIADGGGTKKRFLAVYCFTGVAATLALVLPVPWWAVGALILVGNIGFEGGNVFYNGFLPQVAAPGGDNTLSSAGYAAGYIGGVVVLIASLMFFVPPRGEVRHAFLLVGAWWGGFALLTMAWVAERPPRRGWEGTRGAVVAAWREVAATVGGIRRYPQAALFLAAFLLYNDGIATIISNATPFALQNIYLDDSLTAKIGLAQLIPAIIMIQLIAAPSSMVWSAVANRYGEKRAIYGTLVVFTGVIAYGQVALVLTEFYVMSVLIGLVLGGAQAISRSLFGSLIPEEKHAEFFGFFALSSKFSAFAGPFVYGALLLATGETRLALLSLTAFFIAGGAVLYVLDVEQGRRDAARA